MVRVADDLATRLVHSTDNSIYQLVPAAVAAPRTVSELSSLLADNHRSAAPLPIAARGGATGTNGQSLTDGLVVDVKRHLHRILSVDAVARLAVVEPGVVAAQLDQTLAPHGMRWAPHTSTMTRATVGGMISTDAAGKGSLVHGRTHRHVAAVDLCLADGTIVHLEPTPIDEAHRLAKTPGSAGRLWAALVDLPRLEPGSIGPALGRSWTGYGLDRLHADGVVDPVQLVVGAEGTLGVVTAAWLRLLPRPATTTMVVARYHDFETALRDSLDLAGTAPTAIEAVDESTLAAARSSNSWPSLATAIADEHEDGVDGAVLILEYDDSTTDGVGGGHDDLVGRVRATGRSRHVTVIDDDAERRSIWSVRADAVGLLARRVVAGTTAGGEPTAARPVAMVEDCAVPVDRLPAFISRFRRLLDDAGLAYGMFGHADVGCVHVRPALDLTDPAHATLVGDLTDRVVELVAEHGGVLWGEHGRGMRSSVVERVLDAHTIELMRRVKTAFDPDDRCNPGKLYRPIDVDEPVVGPLDAPLRGALDRTVPVEIRTAHASAFSCNGNGRCHDVIEASPMCPSYQASGDPAWSPKGRADLLRAWLTLRHGTLERHDRERPSGATIGGSSPGHEPGHEPGRDDGHDDGPTTGHGPGIGTAARLPDVGDVEAIRAFEDALATNLDACLSCSACAGRCPLSVDIPELKSRFFESYFADRRRPVAHHALGMLERLAPVAARAPCLARVAARGVAPAMRLVDLPIPARPTRPRRPIDRFDPDAARAGRLDIGPTVGDRPHDRAVDTVVVPDVFTAVLEPDTATAAHEVLLATGHRVAIAPLLVSGKFDHVVGRRRAFARAARRRHDLLRSIAEAGAVAVSIEPAITLLHRHDDVGVDARFADDSIRSLAETLLDRVTPPAGGTRPRGDVPSAAMPSVEMPSAAMPRAELPRVDRALEITLLGHCTERALDPDEIDRWATLLTLAGHRVEVVEVGCCGMAGGFGHQRQHQTMSRDLWTRTWAPVIDGATGVVAATGWSCRSQASRFGRRLVHPVELLVGRA